MAYGDHTADFRYPRPLIPSPLILCQKCGHGTKTLMGADLADGYMRRHKCQHHQCGWKFYSLSSYIEPGNYTISPQPYEPRPLTPYEKTVRQRVIDQYTADEAITHSGTLAAYLPTQSSDPFMRVIEEAFSTQPDRRSVGQDIIVEVINNLKEEIENL